MFAEGRGRLFGIAYRILGNAADAEDVVQDVWIRWQSRDRSDVREPMAFLATTTTRAAINVLQSGRVRYERALDADGGVDERSAEDPSVDVELGEELERATYLMMERLSPTERAAYVLRVGFEYPYQRIARVIGSSEPAVRQLVSRARKHLTATGRRAVDRGAHQRLLAAVRNAARGGDAVALERELSTGGAPA